MTFSIKEKEVIINTDNYRASVPKNNFSNAILNEKILSELSFDDLKSIWKQLYGIPQNIKDILKKKIELYDSSPIVNSFYYEGKEYWIDKENRTSLWNLSNSNFGDIEFVVGDQIITLNSFKLKAFLIKLELYAYKCYVNTFKHYLRIKDLTELDDIVNYDYTTGYPDKITLE